MKCHFIVIIRIYANINCNKKFLDINYNKFPKSIFKSFYKVILLENEPDIYLQILIYVFEITKINKHNLSGITELG